MNVMKSKKSKKVMIRITAITILLNVGFKKSVMFIKYICFYFIKTDENKVSSNYHNNANSANTPLPRREITIPALAISFIFTYPVE